MSRPSKSLNLLEPQQPHQACSGKPLPFFFTMLHCSVLANLWKNTAVSVMSVKCEASVIKYGTTLKQSIASCSFHEMTWRCMQTVMSGPLCVPIFAKSEKNGSTSYCKIPHLKFHSDPFSRCHCAKKHKWQQFGQNSVDVPVMAWHDEKSVIIIWACVHYLTTLPIANNNCHASS